MGKVDLLSIKRNRQQQEEQVTDNIPSELEKSYTSVWGKNREEVEYIELSRLVSFTDNDGSGQPFKLNTKKIEQIFASAKDIGIVMPLIVRKKDTDYEIISGHHRFEVAKRLNQLTAPCVVRNIANNEVYQFVTESNIQRSKTLPSEYGKIFSRYMDMRKDIELTAEEIALKFDVSKKTMYRYINVLKLIPPLQVLTDEEVINLASVDIICNLSNENQNTLCIFLVQNNKKLTPALAKKVIELVSKYNLFTVEDLMKLIENKPKGKYKNKLYNNFSEKYNIKYSEKELDNIIANLFDEYMKKESGVSS